MLTCAEFVKHVHLRDDLDLSGEWAGHSLACEPCGRYLAQTRALVTTARRVGQRPAPVVVAPALLAAFCQGARPTPPSRRWRWAHALIAAVAVGCSAILALRPAAQAAPAGAHPPCAAFIVAAGLLPVLGLWALLRRRRGTVSMTAAAALAAACALAGQGVMAFCCPAAHLQRHLLLSHFGALVAATVLAVAWSRAWSPRAAVPLLSLRR